jgi:hypothetical protein
VGIPGGDLACRHAKVWVAAGWRTILEEMLPFDFDHAHGSATSDRKVDEARFDMEVGCVVGDAWTNQRIDESDDQTFVSFIDGEPLSRPRNSRPWPRRQSRLST